MNDDPLDVLKQNWKDAPVRNPSFRAEVWKRIDQRRNAPEALWDWLRIHLGGITAAAAASMLAAALLGAAFGRASSDRSEPASLEVYLTSIDPHRQMEQGESRPQ